MEKIFQEGDYEAIHENPVWRDKANFIIAAYLGEKEGRNEWEQLWASRIDKQHFLICCIPFFIYDIALGDEVETDKNYVIERVIKTSNNFTFRVWFGNTTFPRIKDAVLKKMEELHVELEWSSKNLLACSVNNANHAQQIADYLHAQQNAKHLMYETGRST